MRRERYIKVKGLWARLVSVAGAKRLSPALARRNAQGYVPDAVNCVLCVGCGWHRASQQALADQLHIDRSTWAYYETGKPGRTSTVSWQSARFSNRLPHPVRWARTAPPRWAGRRGADDDLQFI